MPWRGFMVIPTGLRWLTLRIRPDKSASVQRSVETAVAFGNSDCPGLQTAPPPLASNTTNARNLVSISIAKVVGYPR
jgi:hypothetical protein